MGLFDNMFKSALNGLQNAVGKAVEGAVRPAADKLAGEAVNAVTNVAADKINQAANSAIQSAHAANAAAGEAAADANGAPANAANPFAEMGAAFAEANAAFAEAQQAAQGVSQEQWDQAFSFLEGMANNAAKNLKVCPNCGETSKADIKFCPSCGTKLPEMTVAQLSICPACGYQNAIGTSFCAECGTKLPSKIAEEEAAAAKDAAVMAKWDAMLPQYPKWNCGGTDFDLVELEQGRFYFCAWFHGDESAAQASVNQYRELLKESGFRTAGKYPSEDHLYKMIDGVCYHGDTEHCFESESDSPSIYFHNGDEPQGGFDYVKPEPAPKKKPGGLFGSLFG